MAETQEPDAGTAGMLSNTSTSTGGRAREETRPECGGNCVGYQGN